MKHSGKNLLLVAAALLLTGAVIPALAKPMMHHKMMHKPMTHKKMAHHTVMHGKMMHGKKDGTPGAAVFGGAGTHQKTPGAPL